jgi:hypothetical protein
MNIKEIRDSCLKCGYHKRAVVEGSVLSTDVCRLAATECSMITKCEPSVRIPKEKVRRYTRSKMHGNVQRER